MILVLSVIIVLLKLQIRTQAVTGKAIQKKLVAQESLGRYFSNLLLL
jgi:hypothetical protein